jgi:hypothetical protein
LAVSVPGVPGVPDAIGVVGVVGAIADAPLFLELLFPLDDKARE